MTEKIVIDGVDVAGCVRLQDDKISCDLGGECKGWENCYYKQLKRLEQENKELKVVKEQLKKWNDENLKRQDEMQKWIDLAEEQRKNYRSALEEIRKIINGHASPSACEYYGSYKNACEPCALRILKQTEGKIIDKINEVLQCE